MISPSRQPSASVPRLCNAIQLAFLDDSLVRFIGIFNPVLTVIAFGWQELRDLINAVRAAATEGSGHKAHRLTDFEFMLVHRTSIMSNGIAHHLCGGTGQFQLSASREILLPRNCLGGDFKGLHFVVYVASRLGQALCPDLVESLTIQRPG